ncbi:DinB family protein [Mucilaginibacter segetis]|uniref:DinB family protein n=1 Tax=Mucilaginibacter segetis TaxID=2793071 RepID=A0A934PWB3_9SPHI|nr:DinB family protein [Mucilaginibacter segetis]MBK0380595.1 DinB family protein [Mucilaginibacter segetis]
MKIIRSFILTFILFITALCSVKARTTDSLETELARKWANSKAYALKMAELMPEKDYDFKPVAEEMSFKEQLLHIADNMKWLVSSYLKVDVPKAKPDAVKLNKADVIKIIADAYDYGLKAHYTLSPAQLNEKVSFFAGPLTRRQILILMHDHQTHHLGQLIVYLRLKGIKPPDYVGW